MDDDCIVPSLPTPATAPEIITALLGGSSARFLRKSIRGLSCNDYRKLCCMLCCMRDEVAANCRERATEIDRVLAAEGTGGLANCKIYSLSSGHCPHPKNAALLD